MSPSISIDFENNQLHYSYDQFGSPTERYEERIYKKTTTPSPEAWVEFLEVCDAIDVRSWSNNVYRDDEVFDATSWKIHIDSTLQKDEKVIFQVDASGYAVCPDKFDLFVHAVEKLIHESITSMFYNAQIMKDFVEDSIKGEKSRKKLFMKASPIILEIIEGDVASYLLDYSIEDILDKYMNLLTIFGVSKSDESIMKYYIVACAGEENQTGIEILDFIDPSMREVYENECRRLLTKADIWYLDKEAQEDIDALFTRTRWILLYADQRKICCESYRRDEINRRKLSVELAEIVINLKIYTDKNMITHGSYSPTQKLWLTGSVGKYLEHIEEETKKIKEIGCCMRLCDNTLLKDQASHNMALILSKKIFDEVLKFIDRLHIIFQGRTYYKGTHNKRY